MGVALLLACAASTPTADTGPATPVSGDPTLQAATWGCSEDEDRWSLTAEANRWTGNGGLALTLDGLYVEEHEVRSVEAARDGTWDRLALDLEIVADPREVAPGERTAFLCDPPTRDGLAARLWIHPPSSSAIADCWTWGPPVDWAAAGYTSACTAVEPPPAAR